MTLPTVSDEGIANQMSPYTTDDVANAIAEIKNGKCYSYVSQRYGIPYLCILLTLKIFFNEANASRVFNCDDFV